MVGSLQSYSATLRRAIETPTRTVYTDNGAETRPAPWEAPAVVTSDMQREAVHALGSLKLRGAPAPQSLVEQWVAHLANLCAGKDLPPEAKLAGITSSIIRGGYPAAIFDDADTLDRIARKFQWWPGWAELAPVLDNERGRLRSEWERLSVIARGGKSAQREELEDEQPTGPRTMSEATEKLMAEFWARNGGRPAARSMGGN